MTDVGERRYLVERITAVDDGEPVELEPPEGMRLHSVDYIGERRRQSIRGELSNVLRYLVVWEPAPIGLNDE